MTQSHEQQARELCIELYDRFVMGGWEPMDALSIASGVIEAAHDAGFAEARTMASGLCASKRMQYAQPRGSYGSDQYLEDKGRSSGCGICENAIRALLADVKKEGV